MRIFAIGYRWHRKFDNGAAKIAGLDHEDGIMPSCAA